MPRRGLRVQYRSMSSEAPSRAVQRASQLNASTLDAHCPLNGCGMKRTFLENISAGYRVIAVVCLTVSLATIARAQDPGDAGVFADSLGTVTTLDVLPGEPFDIHVVAFELPEIAAYEGSLQGLPANVIVLAFQYIAPQLFTPYDPLNFIVGANGCVTRDSRYLLGTWTLLSMDPVPDDTAVILSAANPSSTDLEGRPGYALCDLETIVPFGIATNGGPNYPNGALILNATGTPGPVSGTTQSVGSLKARF